MAVAMGGVVALVAVATIAVTGLAAVYATRAQAQVAADAAALAAAVSTYPPASEGTPLASAREVAARNGASVVSCGCSRDASLATRTVEVVAEIGVNVPVFGEITVRASGRAEFDPRRWLGR